MSERTLRALRAMAAQTDSPHEAAIAREKLAILESYADPDYEYNPGTGANAQHTRQGVRFGGHRVVRRWRVQHLKRHAVPHPALTGHTAGGGPQGLQGMSTLNRAQQGRLRLHGQFCRGAANMVAVAVA